MTCKILCYILQLLCSFSFCLSTFYDQNWSRLPVPLPGSGVSIPRQRGFSPNQQRELWPHLGQPGAVLQVFTKCQKILDFTFPSIPQSWCASMYMCICTLQNKVWGPLIAPTSWKTLRGRFFSHTASAYATSVASEQEQSAQDQARHTRAVGILSWKN